jgi:hypothetical protein
MKTTTVRYSGTNGDGGINGLGVDVEVFLDRQLESSVLSNRAKFYLA